MTLKHEDILLKLENVKKYYPITAGIFKKTVGYVKAVDDVSLEVYRGETLGIVGESGCGKTTLGKGILRLFDLTEGRIQLKLSQDVADRSKTKKIGDIAAEEDNRHLQHRSVMKDLTSLNKKESFQARRQIQMVFQDPYASLNPMKNIFSSFDEPMKIHKLGDKEQRKNIISEMLRTVNLQPDYMYRFPHEFSGGQRQRICIAKALAMDPEVIVCDEPVSALDVSIQAQIMNLMKKIQKQYKLTYVFIAHDLSVVQYMSNRIAVMYLGKIVEVATAKQFHINCLHPYTRALLSAVPIPIVGARKERIILKGDVPSPVRPPQGCRFHPRCAQCMEICKVEEPTLRPSATDPHHLVACHLYD